MLAFSMATMTGCKKEGKPQETKPVSQPADMTPADKPAQPEPSKPAVTFDRVPRLDFNRLAARLNLPVFWVEDANKNNAVDPSEVVTLLFYDTAPRWVDDGVFTQEFIDAYERIVKAQNEKPKGKDEAETRRIALMWEELDQGRPMLVYNRLKLDEKEKKFLARMRKVAELIDVLYEKQNGLLGLYEKIPVEDTASRRVFARNRGITCEGPKTEKNPECRAIAGMNKVPVDVYPADMQGKDGFCKELAQHKDEKIRDPFTVVRVKDGQLTAVPYSEAYAENMKAVSEELKAAAAELDPQAEGALAAYLNAAAQAFLDNNWFAADEKWAAMNGRNSKWYVRVGPDETYWEPCNLKAGFHLTLARINPDSITWQEKLSPIRQEMEDLLAKLAGAPYQARKADFSMPDFIDIVINAGDDRKGLGGTIGQSLPNWGPVAGRGRTVVMSNLYTDPDSLAARREQAQSLFTAESLAAMSDKKLPGMLGTILHEATHNLGPSHEYKVKGKKDDEVFGGPLSTVLEELKAQSGALFFVDFLLKKGLLTPAEANDSYMDAIVWSMGHISRGMYAESGTPKPYSQLAAIHVGILMEEGAMEWKEDALAANQKDKGAFVVHLEKFPAAIEKIMQQVAKIKATGDKAAAEAMVKKYVDEGKIPFAVITERYLRQPKSSFVYALDVE